MHMHITPCYNLPRQLYRDQRDAMFLCLVVLPNGISETIKHHMLNVTVSTIDGERERVIKIITNIIKSKLYVINTCLKHEANSSWTSA